MKRASLFFGVFGVLAVLAAGFALAAAINITSTAQWFQSRVFIGGKTTGTLPTASDQNGIADTRGAYFAWDFPSIGPGGAGQHLSDSQGRAKIPTPPPPARWTPPPTMPPPPPGMMMCSSAPHVW
mgnify:CR=1 FL=1